MAADTYTLSGMLRKEVWMDGKVEGPERRDGVRPRQTPPLGRTHGCLRPPAEDTDVKVSWWEEEGSAGDMYF